MIFVLPGYDPLVKEMEQVDPPLPSLPPQSVCLESMVEKQPKLTIRERIFLTLSEPSSSSLAYVLSFYFDSLVALSMIVMCSETVAQWSQSDDQKMMWQTFETILTANFFIDFLLKTVTARPLKRYIFTKPTFSIDLLGLLPYFVERIVGLWVDKSESFKALRVLRMLRFFRLSRIAYENFPDVRLFIEAVKRSRLAIAFLGMYVFGAGLFFASCIYFAETNECTLVDSVWFYTDFNTNVVGDVRCVIQNMFEAWWFTLVTMTTVGYGDTVVQSAWGRILTVMIMIASLIFLALPAAIFAANLTEMYLEQRLIKRFSGKDHHNNNNSHAAHQSQSYLDSRLTSPKVVSKSERNTEQEVLKSAKTIFKSNIEEEELENLLQTVGTATEQVNSALTSLTTQIAFIQHQQHKIEEMLKKKR